jgi:ABC-type transport system involved in multi-copper enzyme maturation permease subunit
VTEMIRRFLRQKSRSAGTLVVLVLFAAASAFSIAASGGQTGADGGAGYLVLFVLAAASVSRDASSGALQMILVRPIRRTDYLFGRYLGVLFAFAAFLVACALFAVVVKAAVQHSGPPLEPATMVANVGYGVLRSAQTAAMLLFFSTFLPGYGDVIAVACLQLFLSIQTNVGWFQKVAEVGRREILAPVDWERVFRGEPSALSGAGRGVLSAVVFLAAAALIFSRREFAYGQD